MILNLSFSILTISSIFSGEIDNFFPFMVPGLYAITCIITSCVYIGHSDNCVNWISQHNEELNAKNYKFSNPKFQEDWDNHGYVNFKSSIILADNNCYDNNYRKIKEAEFIGKIPENLRYNVKYGGTTTNNTLQFYVVSFNGVIYNNFGTLLNICNQSLIKAGKRIISKEKLRATLFEQFPNTKGFSKRKAEIDPILKFSQCVVANQVVYANIETVVTSGLCESVEQAMKFLQDETNQNWFFLSVASPSKLLSLSVDNHIYSNAGQVVKNGFSDSEETVYERLMDKKYPNWYWLSRKTSEYQNSKESKKRTGKPIIIDEQLYKDAEAVVEVGLASNVALVQKRIAKKTFPTWNYAYQNDQRKGSPIRQFQTPHGKFNKIQDAVDAGIIKDRHDLYRKMKHVVSKKNWYYLE